MTMAMTLLYDQSSHLVTMSDHGNMPMTMRKMPARVGSDYALDRVIRTGR